LSDTSTHILRITLQDDPKVVREIELPSDRKLVDLAQGIVRAFNFDFDHAFGFYSALEGHVMRSEPKYELFADMDDTDLGERTDARSVKRTAIAEPFPAVGHKMLFLFDYGDDWRFVVEVIGRGKKDRKARYPKVLRKIGEAPPQYRWDEEEEDESTD
jgi:hypothetical protein